VVCGNSISIVCKTVTTHTASWQPTLKAATRALGAVVVASATAVATFKSSHSNRLQKLMTGKKTKSTNGKNDSGKPL